MNPKPTSRSRGALLLRAVMQALDEAGGSLPRRDVLKIVPQKVALTPYDLERYEATGNLRWYALLQFFSVDFVKAGFLIKADGSWSITPEGRETLKQTPEQALTLATKAYRQWKAERLAAEGQDTSLVDMPELKAEPVKDITSVARTLTFESAQDQALAEIEDYLRSLGPYEFQALVAALLEAMGYAIVRSSEPGADGGTDIIAYRDPLGTVTPHVRVQVKHRLKSGTKATREEVSSLRGILRSDRESGLFVSSAGFTREAEREASSGNVHVHLIDLELLLRLWTQHYDKLREPQKALLRIAPVWFLAPE